MATPSQQDEFLSGSSIAAHHFLGAHPLKKGFSFTVYAPLAKSVRLVGDFNGWNAESDTLSAIGNGFWRIEFQDAQVGQTYKYVIEGGDGYLHWKADPFAARAEMPPKTASVLCAHTYRWTDKQWLQNRHRIQSYDQPLSIYELHMGSWRHRNGGLHTYKSIAKPLIEHVQQCGFTHVEFLPLTHHPFYGSWGYQCTGYFAPSPLYGSPKDLKSLINSLHKAGIGVIMDWAPAHFPMDEHGLYRFDGTALFSEEDPRRGHHPDWGTAIFNYGHPGVSSFLLSSAAKWIEEFHIDGLRVDAVASMLYLNYSRNDGEWIPNHHGGPENLDAVAFLKKFNDSLHSRFPGILTIAEESTAWPGVTAPTAHGGLGFDYKWDMGWMNDTLEYFQLDPIYRKHNHQKLTFRGLYVHSERFLLPLSHDEVVHMKGALPSKMPGDKWQQLASVRCLLAWQAAQPGKSLLFMGMEFGQRSEWNHDDELDWGVLDDVDHQGLMRFVSELNALVNAEPALHAVDFDHSGVQWTQMDDADNSVIVFIRQAPEARPLIIAFNFTPVVRYNYAVGAPWAGDWNEVMNSDSYQFGGSGVISAQRVSTESFPAHGQPQSLLIGLPPLGVSIWAPEVQQ